MTIESRQCLMRIIVSAQADSNGATIGAGGTKFKRIARPLTTERYYYPITSLLPESERLRLDTVSLKVTLSVRYDV